MKKILEKTINQAKEVSKKFADILKDESNVYSKYRHPEESLIFISSQIVLFIGEVNFDYKYLDKYLQSRYKDKYLVFNMTKGRIDFKNTDKIIEIECPTDPSYSLQFILEFCIKVKSFISKSSDNILLIHDYLVNVCFILLF